MSNDVAVLQQRLASAEAAAARLSNQVTVGAEQNKALRTTVVGLEASVERKAREIQALAALVDVDDPIGNAMAPPPSAQRTAQQLYPDIFDDDKPSAAQQAIQGASRAKRATRGSCCCATFPAGGGSRAGPAEGRQDPPAAAAPQAQQLQGG